MRYENYVRSEIWNALERAYGSKPQAELDPVALEHYVSTLMPYMLQYGEGAMSDELDSKENVLDNIDDINQLVQYDYISCHNLGVCIATGSWTDIDDLFKKRWVDELTTIVVNDYIQYRKEM